MGDSYRVFLTAPKGRQREIALVNGKVTALGSIDVQDPTTWADVIGTAMAGDPGFTTVAGLTLIAEALGYRNPVPDPTSIKPGLTAADILAAEELQEPVTWLPFLGQSGVVAEGWSHCIAGYPGSGKSPLCQHATVPWLNLGKRVTWVSEESRSIWRAGLDRLQAIHGDSVPWANLRIIFASGKTAAELLQETIEVGFDVLVLDTLRAVCQPVKEQDPAEIRIATAPWLALAVERGATLLILHHVRKQEGEHGERIAGSHAILGAFDIGMEYRWGSHENQRGLHGVRLRGGHPKPHLVVEQREDFGQLIILGESGYLKTKERDSLVVEKLEELARPVTTKELRAELGRDSPTLDTLERSLLRMARKQVIRRLPPLSIQVSGKVVKWQSIDLFE